MLHPKSAQSAMYRLVSGLRLVFWILCLTLGGVGLHLSPGNSENTQEVSQIDASDFTHHYTPDSPEQ